MRRTVVVRQLDGTLKKLPETITDPARVAYLLKRRDARLALAGGKPMGDANEMQQQLKELEAHRQALLAGEKDAQVGQQQQQQQQKKFFSLV